jgi:hypothetical protein
MFFLSSCRLEFDCTNNTVKNESLVQGMKRDIYLSTKEIKVLGDIEIIVRKVKNPIHCKSPNVRNY